MNNQQQEHSTNMWALGDKRETETKGERENENEFENFTYYQNNPIIKR